MNRRTPAYVIDCHQEANPAESAQTKLNSLITELKDKNQEILSVTPVLAGVCPYPLITGYIVVTTYLTIQEPTQPQIQYV